MPVVILHIELRNPSSELNVMKTVQKRNNHMISRANQIAQEVLNAETTEKSVKKREVNFHKTLSKFYWEYILQFEKSLAKGESTFPTMPFRTTIYKILSQYNSNDKAVEKRYRNVKIDNRDLASSEALYSSTFFRDLCWIRWGWENRIRPLQS
jgi:hypothetical protein